MENNNYIRIHKIDGSVISVDELPGITVNFRGDNSEIEFYEPLPKFSNCRFVLSSGCSIIICESRHYIDGLCVYQKGSDSKLYIGKDFSCYSTLIDYDEPGKIVHIGDGCMFANNIAIRTSDAHSIIDMSTGKVMNFGKSVYIGNNVWIARDCIILKGVSIADNCMIGAKSCVTKSISTSNSLIVGTPAKVKRTNIFWDRATPDKYNNYYNEKQTIDMIEYDGLFELDKSTILVDTSELNIEATNTSWNSQMIFDNFESYSEYHLFIGEISQIKGRKINYCQLAVKDVLRNTGIGITNVILGKTYEFLIKTKAIINPLELKIYAGVAGDTSGIALKINTLKLVKLNTLK